MQIKKIGCFRRYILDWNVYSFAPGLMKILLPFDQSASSEQAIGLLEAYGGDRAGTTPVLLNVQSPSIEFWASMSAPLLEKAQLEAAERIVATPRSRLEAAGYPVGSQVRIGSVAVAILDAAMTLEVDAILMGTRGRGGLPGFIGSAAMRVVHGARVPVILVRDGMRLPRAMGTSLQVLLPVDNSPHSDRAVEQAVLWRRWLGISRTRILHVTSPLTVLELTAPPHRDAIELWSGTAAEQAASKAKSTVAGAGLAHDAAIEAAEDIAVAIVRHAGDFDLIIMGSRGLGAVSHALLGSVAFKVACMSPVPVVLVAKGDSQ